MRFNADQSPMLPLGQHHVMLAEDCVDQGRLYLHYLKQAGAEVTLECNGQSVVEAVQKFPDLYDAVVMDFLMPKMDGLFATQKLREQGYQGAIVAITAHDSEDLKVTWMQEGCNAYLAKPVAQETLIHTLQEQLELRAHSH